MPNFALYRYAYRWEWRPGKLPVVKLEPPSAAKSKSARPFHGVREQCAAAARPLCRSLSALRHVCMDDVGRSLGVASRSCALHFLGHSKSASI